MPLHEVLSAGRIAILSEPDNRTAVIDAAARLLAEAHAGPSEFGMNRADMATTIRDSLIARERLASTAIGHGVAIPHGRIEFLEKSQGAFLRLDHPIDFGAADGRPVDLVMAMAVPLHSAQHHLQLLAEVAERFADAGFREQLRRARDAEELGRHLFADTDRDVA